DRHHRLRRRRRQAARRHVAGQRHRRHRVVPEAGPQPAPHRAVPRGRARRRRHPHPGHRLPRRGDAVTVTLPDGLVAVVKRDCPTCQLITPVLAQLRATPDAPPLTVYTQDDPSFPPDLDPVDDTGLAVSLALDLDTVPTLVRVEDGRETDRLVGWSREQWEAFTGLHGLGDGLPPHRPGCGSKTQDPDVAAARAETAAAGRLASRRVELGASED